MDGFRQVDRRTPRALHNLLAAAEAVGNDERVCKRPTHGRQKFELRDRERDVTLLFFEPESASHPTASGRGHFELCAHALQHRLLVRHLHDRFVMAMTVHESTSFQLGELKPLCLFLQEFTEQEDLLGEFRRAIVIWKKIEHFFAEYRSATWFEY